MLAGGIAYAGFFALFPLLAVGFTALATVLNDNRPLQERVARYVNASLGGELVGLQPGRGVVQLDVLAAQQVLSLTGVVALVLLLITGLGWIVAIREGVRAVFGRPPAEASLRTVGRDVLVLVCLGLAVLASALIGVGVLAATGAVQRWLGLGSNAGLTVLVAVFNWLLVFAVDAGIYLVAFRVLGGARAALSTLLPGALVGSVGLGLLKLFGGLLLHRAGGANRFLAASSVLVGVLVWMGLAGRVTLLAAAWTASGPAASAVLPPASEPGSAGSDRPDGSTPSFGARSSDRVAIGAGAVLGASAAVALTAALRAGRTLGRGLRGRRGEPLDP